MTITNNYTPTKVLGNGSTTVYTGSWPIFNSAWLVLASQNVSTGVQTPYVLGTDYTLTFTSSGWVATFGTPPPSTVYVVGSRNITLAQTVPYSTSQGFQGLQEETSFDIVTAMLQDLQDELNRAPQLPVGNALANFNLPFPVANLALKWDPTAMKIINSTYDPDASGNAAASAAAAASSASSAAAAAAAAAASAASITFPIPIASGGTGVTTAGAARTALGFTDANLSTSDVTTNNASTSKHGFLVKLSGNSTDYVGGDNACHALPSLSGGLLKVDIITSSGTWTKPVGTNSMDIDLVGGGGDGVGNAGGTTSFGSYCSATGGVGGQNPGSADVAGGAGGVGSSGDINDNGQQGANSSPAVGGYTWLAGGQGGVNGAGGASGANGATNGVGVPTGSGGGGGGRARKRLTTSLPSTVSVTIGAAGGTGAQPGYVIVRSYS